MLSFFGGGLVPGLQREQGRRRAAHESLAIAYAADGIRVNAIAPGWVRTPLTQALQDDPERSAAILARTPLGAGREPDDIAGAAVFLGSPAAAFVTGVVLPVDGGYHGRQLSVPRGRWTWRSTRRSGISKGRLGEGARRSCRTTRPTLGCWAHGIVHMLEGDLGNARYWYRRAAALVPARARPVRRDRRARRRVEEGDRMNEATR